MEQFWLDAFLVVGIILNNLLRAHINDNSFLLYIYAYILLDIFDYLLYTLYISIYLYTIVILSTIMLHELWWMMNHILFNKKNQNYCTGRFFLICFSNSEFCNM